MDFGQSLRNIKTVCVANRGEIAVRCIKACKELGVKSVAIFTNADAGSLHVALADEPVLLRGSDSTAYTDGDAIIDICKKNGVDAIIPGYGFLSENTDFAAAAEKAGITFVGPTSASIKKMGLKHEARELAVAANVPVIPGTGLLSSATEAAEQAEQLGFPVMLKATGGGGGMGLQICHSAEEVHGAFALVESRAGSLFKNSGVFLEKYYPRSRHIEVQVAGNGDVVVAFGERECSIQRRHQKVVEECPSPFVARTPGLRDQIVGAAIRFASQLKYRSVGTVEFLVDDETAGFFFLEMNTRLQVEHGITELCYGVDLVHLMLHQADYERGGQVGIPSEQLVAFGETRRAPNGAAIEVRIYAEVPLRDFAPSPGVLQFVQWPQGDGIRVDTWVQSGQTLTSYYDPLIGKVMVHSAEGRPAAQQKMLAVLEETMLQGTQNNLEYLLAVLKSEDFGAGNTLTNLLASFKFDTCAIQVINPGVFTTVQDYPGRTSTGHGIPKSGPMDDVSSRVANILVGNDTGVEVLEITLSGPELLFHVPAIVAVCGAHVPVSVDGDEAGMWSRFVVQKGQTLKIGNVSGNGFRSYLAIKGGFPQIPTYLGSKSTTPELAIGGVQGRKLQMHDILALDPKTTEWAESTKPVSLPASAFPDLTFKHVHCMDGPFGSDDMLTPEGRHTIYNTPWKVSHNSGRSGVRMIGPQLQWARASGGGGGSHPSNVFDYGYPVGGINWTGDSPVIFSCDSPDIGGFACPVTICTGDRWKLGQLKPGDEVHLSPTTLRGALQIIQQQDEYLAAIAKIVQGEHVDAPLMHTDLPVEPCPAILHHVKWDARPDVKYRQGGDASILVEYGNQVADLRNTACVQILTRELEARKIKGVRLAPSIFTVTLHYDLRQISQGELMEILLEIDKGMADVNSAHMPAREVRLPVCLDHPAIQEATDRYMHNIRDKAVYLPDNVEYLRRNNALKARQDVFDSLLKTSWLTVAVGFYVGTPIMFPLDPRYVYVGQKYNPSRIYTPSGAIGIGGSLLAIYPVAAPGGYQLMGRTLGVWDGAGNRPGFSVSKPWLFNYFDVVTFHEVSEEEYDKAERDFSAGRYTFDISETVLDMEHYIRIFQTAEKDPQYQEWRKLQDVAAHEVATLEARMTEQWTAEKAASSGGGSSANDFSEMENAVKVESPIDASVWKVEVKVGDVLEAGQTVVILEAMKMEIKVQCSDEHVGAVVKSIVSPPGTVVSPGALLVVATKET